MISLRLQCFITAPMKIEISRGLKRLIIKSLTPRGRVSDAFVEPLLATKQNPQLQDLFEDGIPQKYFRRAHPVSIAARLTGGALRRRATPFYESPFKRSASFISFYQVVNAHER